MESSESGNLMSGEKESIKWIYTMSVPSEEGEPSIEIVIGVPQNAKTTGWLLPHGSAENHLNYTIKVPINFIIGNQKIECEAEGTVFGDYGGNKFELGEIRAKQGLPKGAGEAVLKAYKRMLDPAKNRTVYDALSQEIERQCRGYVSEQKEEK